VVDELLGRQEVVIKGLGDALGQVPGLAGGAILGDGRIGLILDVRALLDRAHRAAVLPTAA
jgi:two-component system chemotaxis sensor kinase CheA